MYDNLLLLFKQNIELQTILKKNDVELYLWIDNIKLTGEKSNSTIKAESGLILESSKEKKTDKTVSIDTEYYTWPTFKEGATFFLGAFDEGGKGYISLTFNDAYNFTYDAIKVFANPVNQYVKDVEQLRENACKDIVIDNDFIHGTVTCDTDSLLRLCREAGITVPIIPGLKPLSTVRQLTLLPEAFSLDIPLELSEAMRKAGDDKEKAYRTGTEWCTMQCKDLLAHGVQVVHFYTMGKPKNIVEILKACF